MFDAEMTALLRAVLDEVCESVPRHETAARTHVASVILEAASKGETSLDGLKQIGRSALRDAPIVRNSPALRRAPAGMARASSARAAPPN
jgi:hypothetical protein